MGKPVPFRLTEPITPEEELHLDVKRTLETLVKPPAMWAHYPAGSVPLPARYGAKLNRMGLRRGWPDFLVIHVYPYGIELKRVGGQLSRTRLVRTQRGALKVLDGQVDVFPLLEAAGMRIAICRSVPEVEAALAGWGVPLHRTS